MKSTCSVHRSFVQTPFGRFAWRMSLVCSVLAIFCCSAVQAATVKWKAASVEAYLGLPIADLEFEDPLTGTEVVAGYPVLEWLDADYNNPGVPRYEDWSVSDPAVIQGNFNEIWMLTKGHRIWTSTTRTSTIVSIHLIGDWNDGIADVLVDDVLVATLDMNGALGGETALLVVTDLPSGTHQVQVNDMGASPTGLGNDDVAVLGAAALASRAKWSQPPVLVEPTNVFYGWNEFSVYRERIAADDWVNATNVTVAIGAIRWWGSFLGWSEAEQPPLPAAFHIGVWTDTPAFVDGYSHPGTMMRDMIVTNFTHRFVGWDFDPRTGTFEACYQFDQVLPAGQWVFAPGQVSWISIAAIYQQELPPYPWGWKTRPRDPSSQAPDDAVRIFEPRTPTPGESYLAGEPIWWPTPTNSWDLAFELFSGATPGTVLRWSQQPVPYQVPDGFIGWNEVSVAGSQIVADDWVCTRPEPVTDLHWWGSFVGWSNPTNVPAVSPYGFLVTIWTDVPAGEGLPFSHPGQVRWRTVCTNFTREFAGWDFDPRNPRTPPEACFKFEQDLSRQEWFQQEPGTNIYWISIAALYRTGQLPWYPWGWKTRPRDPNSLAPDDAVLITNPTAPLPGSVFQAGEPIEYPPGVSWDTAFVLTTSACQPPVIERQPQDVTVECRGTASLSVVPGGTPPFSYQWYMNGTPIPGAINSTYTIPDVDLSGSGSVFTVVVANDCGSVTSRGALLTVVDTIQPDIVCPPDMVLGAPTWTGTVVAFSAAASDTCDPNPLVVCQPPSGSVFAVGQTTVFCTATDWSGNTASCAFKVTVLYADSGTNLAKWVQGPNLSASNNSISFVANHPRILADDFLCTYTGPITDIHLWGVWDQDLVDTNAVFCLALWSDRPAANDLPSNPANLLWSQCFTSGQYAFQLVTNLTPEITGVPCSPPYFWILDLESMSYLEPCTQRAWRYDFSIPPAQALTQTNGQIYWLSVSVRSSNTFGWTMTREPWDNYWNDPATSGHLNAAGQPLGDWSVDSELRHWDQAFAITTTPTEPNVFKWMQTPDLGTNGLDVLATLPTILADDFRCTQTGPITDIHLWGSWLNDAPDTNTTFRLSLWSDVPANPPGFSRPGQLLWSEVFTPGQYNGILYAQALERFYDPNLNDPAGFIGQDTAVWQYDFRIPAARAYTQTNGTIYWLGVSAQPSLTNVLFGWKSCPTNWNDDAVFGHMAGPGQPLQDWRELRHPETGRSLDLAFAITTPPVVVEPTSDLGDAPDSSNNHGAAMTAYPPGGVAGVLAQFPTVYQTGSPPYGPNHQQPWALAWLGNNVSLEVEADVGPDLDGPNNIVPPVNVPDLDGADDGVIFPLTLPHCALTTFDYIVTGGWLVGTPVCVNVWFDWNRDGDWNDTMSCPDGTFAPEWAVQNQVIYPVAMGPQVVTTLQFRAWDTNAFERPLWMRITLSEREWSPNEPGASGGSGPLGGYDYGETEDYYVTNYVSEVLDFGDAPDRPYPTFLVNDGARHVVVSGMSLGNLIDAEADGQPDDGADEDGVVFTTGLVPGQMATVTVAGAGNGFLNAWVDFNTDGDWDDTGEQIISGQPLSAPSQNYSFPVPWTAVPGSSVAARFRFSTVTNLTYTGQAPDGEVEDYLVLIEPGAIKFLQLPDLSTNGLDVLATVTNMLADDFRCLETGPITDIHVWGSWLNDRVDTNAMFWVGIWTDVPPGELSPNSQPHELYWSRWFKPGEYISRVLANAQERFYDPNTRTFLGGDKQVWQYDFFPDTAFLEQGTSEEPKIYWLSVAAVTSTNTTFGWKTALEHFNDDGVYGHLANGIPLRDWRELLDPTERSLDLAFAITTIRTNWPPCPERTKFYVQEPDLVRGDDILASYNVTLADDFVCTNTGLITNIVVWGSWLDDRVNPNVSFLLGLWTDVPASAEGPSHPGQLLVQHWYHPGDYVVHEPKPAREGFFDPVQGLYLGVDNAAYRYDFVPKSNRWRQDGTVDRPRTYWLSVIAATTNELFGWKTSTDHLQDSAVFGLVDTNWVSTGKWSPMLDGTSQIDLAFSIGTDISPPFITSIVYTYWNKNVVITWNSCPGKVYRLQYKRDLDDRIWKDIPGDVMALGWTASKAAPVTADQRFYRVIQDPPSGPPVLSIWHTPGGGVEVDWAAAGFTLESATSVLGPYAVMAPPVDSGPYTIPAPTGQAFYRLAEGPVYRLSKDLVYSANIVGRVTLNLVAGLNLIANPLNYLDNHLNTILPLPPTAAGTTVFRWDPDSAAQGPPIVFNGTAWTSASPDPNWLRLSPGESFFIQVSAPLSVTFIGEFPQGPLSLLIPAGYSLLASQVPRTDSLGTGPGVGLEFPAIEGDSVFLWNVSVQAYDPPWTYVSGVGWLDGFGNLVPNGPLIPVGTGFALQTPVARRWNVAF